MIQILKLAIDEIQGEADSGVMLFRSPESMGFHLYGERPEETQTVPEGWSWSLKNG